MRHWKKVGDIGILQLPAMMGYNVLKDVRTLLNRIDAKNVGDILIGAKPEEIASLYEKVSFECTVDDLPLLGNEDFAFAYPSQVYAYIYEAVMFNFREIWEKDCLKLDHSPEFRLDETQLLDPFFAGVISEKLATFEQLETVYTVIDVAKLNEVLIAQANNEHRASDQSRNSGGSGPGTFNMPRQGSIAGALASRGG